MHDQPKIISTTDVHIYISEFYHFPSDSLPRQSQYLVSPQSWLCDVSNTSPRLRTIGPQEADQTGCILPVRLH